MRILAVGAHPDDLEVLCAGTLAKYADQGHEIFMANLCSGNMGGQDIEPEELANGGIPLTPVTTRCSVWGHGGELSPNA